MARLCTSYVRPPIPVRSFDWQATREGHEPGDPAGCGPTESAAVNDLLEQEDELLQQVHRLRCEGGL